MVVFTINGERNSGTNFIMNLLFNNGLRVFTGLSFGDVIFFWKHDVPQDNIKHLDDKVVNIIIFRNLDEWLISTYNNPWFMEREPCCFNCFLTRKQKSCYEEGMKDAEYNYYSGKVLNYTDIDKNIFEIRYFKTCGFLRFYEKHKDVVLLNLEYIQNENNCFKFLSELNEKYNLGLKNIQVSIPKNLKWGGKEKNKNYDTEINKDAREIIDRHKNNKIEDFINKLTYKIS